MHKKSEFYQSTCQIGNFYTKCLDLTFSYQNENLTAIVGISEIYSEKTHFLHIYCVNSHHNTTLQYTLQRTDPSVIVNASPLTQLVLSLFTRAFLQNSIPSSNFLQQTDSACTLSLLFNDCLQKQSEIRPSIFMFRLEKSFSVFHQFVSYLPIYRIF